MSALFLLLLLSWRLFLIQEASIGTPSFPSHMLISGFSLVPCHQPQSWLQLCTARGSPICRATPTRATNFLAYVLLALAGDTSPNPGPATCGNCNKQVRWNSKGVCCDHCDKWYHTRCISMSDDSYLALTPETYFECPKCGQSSHASSFYSDASFIEESVDSSTFSSSSSDPGLPSGASSPKQPTRRPNDHKSLRSLTINFQSLKSKLPAFFQVVDSTKPDIIFGTETWLNPDILDAEVSPPNFTTYRKDRSDGYGGALLCISSSLSSSRIPLNTTCDVVACKVTLTKQAPLIAVSAYRPTNNDSDYSEELSSVIRTLALDNPRSPFWLSGDLNLPDIDWDSSSVSGNRYASAINNSFLDLIQDIGLEQTVDFPTRLDNTLDIFATNRPTLVTRCKPFPGIGDHDIVLVDSQTIAPRLKPVKRLIHLWKRADVNALNQDVASFTSNFLSTYSTATPVELLWEEFSKSCQAAISKHVPSKLSSSRFDQPWITASVKRLSRQKQRAFNKAKRSKQPRDWRRYRTLKRQTNNQCKAAHKDYLNTIVGEGNNKRFWSYIKSKRCDASGVSPLKQDGVIYSSPKSQANALNRQFSSVFTTEDLASLPDKGPSPFPTMDNVTISVDGICKLLKDLKPHKATGPDNLSCQFLKCSADKVSPALHLIFQASLLQGKIPSAWKEANVVPLFKKGDRSLPANYRPVSLTSVPCKIFEHILFSECMGFLEKHSILSDLQHGFRGKRSCESQLLISLQDLINHKNSHHQVDAVLLDFSKAFDKVPHCRLISKLTYYGINPQIVTWVQDFLCDRTQRVALRGELSDSAPVTSGVPQGSVLGPLLFLLYINDLPDYVSSSTARLFADDCLLYLHVEDESDAALLQADLDALQSWEREWQMSFNPDKCETLHITSKRTPLTTDYSIHGQNLRQVSSAKYLGCNISTSLSWNHHIDLVCKKANSTLGFLKRNIGTCSSAVKKQAYTTFVRPRLEYASTVWSPSTGIFKGQNARKGITQRTKLEAVQRRAARFITSDYGQRSSPTAMLSDLKLHSLQLRRDVARLCMLHKIRQQQVAIPVNPYFVPLYPSSPSSRANDIITRGHSKRFHVPHSSNDAHLMSYFPATIRLWNGLPASVVAADAIKVYKAGVVAAMEEKHGH